MAKSNESLPLTTGRKSITYETDDKESSKDDNILTENIKPGEDNVVVETRKSILKGGSVSSKDDKILTENIKPGEDNVVVETRKSILKSGSVSSKDDKILTENIKPGEDNVVAETRKSILKSGSVSSYASGSQNGLNPPEGKKSSANRRVSILNETEDDKKIPAQISTSSSSAYNSDETGKGSSHSTKSDVQNKEKRSSVKVKQIPGSIEEIESEIVLQNVLYDVESDKSIEKTEIKKISKEKHEIKVERIETLDVDVEYLRKPIPTTPVELRNELQQTEEEEIISDKISETDVDVVKVIFKINEDNMMFSTFKINTKIINVKERLSKLFKVKVKDFRIKYDNYECFDLVTLAELGIEPFSTIELNIKLSDNSSANKDSKSEESDHTSSSRVFRVEPIGIVNLTVHSNDPRRVIAPGHFKRYKPVTSEMIVKIPVYEEKDDIIVVKIENQCFVKEWLGGYRNSVTKVEYHHASVQTKPRLRPDYCLPLVTRDTQTPQFPFKETGFDTGATKATQMWRTDLFIPNESDRIMKTDPHRFIGINLFVEETRKIVAAIKIQRFYRAYKKRCEEEEMEAYIALCRENERKAQEKRDNAVSDGNIRLIRGVTFPVNRNDFFMLYLTVGKWWKKEMMTIKETKHDELRKAALFDLLQRETTLLWAIERQHVAAKKETLLKQEMKFVETTSRPVIFRNNKGIMSSIDTLETQQAREYQEILSNFLNTNVTYIQRLDTLTTLIQLVQNFDYNECTDEIIDLLQRESDLLVLGMNDEQLKPLRERTRDLFMNNLHKYIVNPSGAHFKSPKHPKTDNTYYQCKHCLKHKLASEFNVHVKMTKFDTCGSCQWLRNISHQRVDLSPFARLLADVRETEKNNCCDSGVCYILQVIGMHYLTTHIWSARSIISHCRNLDQLRFVRFRKYQDWSPWNCILLTLDESFAHLNIDDVDTFYDKFFIDIIHWKHMRAKNHFLPLILNDEFMTKSGLWNDIRDSGKFIHPRHINKFTKSDDFESHQ